MSNKIDTIITSLQIAGFIKAASLLKYYTCRLVEVVYPNGSKDSLLCSPSVAAYVIQMENEHHRLRKKIKDLEAELLKHKQVITVSEFYSDEESVS